MAHSSVPRSVHILGIRGIPAAHGGFETFAEKLALYLHERGWEVTVYCQGAAGGEVVTDQWHGVRRVHVPSRSESAWDTIKFDWAATSMAARSGAICLTLGYNTAVFTGLIRARGLPNLINMDGIEYRRAKWGAWAKLWFRFNEKWGCRLGNCLIADHPGIKAHLRSVSARAQIKMIPYGATEPQGEIDVAALARLGLEPQRYATIIARPEPENSVLEIVKAFSKRPRGMRLCVLGRFEPERNPYHREVLGSASSEVVFPGAIYDQAILSSLRMASLWYFHGHQVGGTNPSLVEALAAGNPVVAHDNQFNRWVADEGARYFCDEADLIEICDSLPHDPDALALMSRRARARFRQMFTWNSVLKEYEKLLDAYVEQAEVVGLPARLAEKR